MALPKATMMAALFFLVMLSVDQYVYASQDLAAAGGLSHGKNIDCNGLCSYRCSKSWKHKMCMRACNTCCQRCNCVPPGTVGNKEVCPCYANMKTHGGRYKCP